MSEPSIEHCRANKHRLRTCRGAWIPCHNCASAWRRANCKHDEHSAAPHWAGILGWRYYCSGCGVRVDDPASGVSV